MSNFTDDLHLTPTASGLWKTERTFSYSIGKKGSNWVVVVPQGFETDLGSIPSAFRWVINPADASCAQAFVLHDYLCQDKDLSRLVTDAVLWDAMVAVEVAHWKRNYIYFGVSMFRWWKWVKTFF